MRSLSFGIVLLLLSLSACMGPQSVEQQAAAPQAASPKYEYNKTPGLEILVLDGGWGDASAEDIETVLHSVAAVLLEHFPGRRLNPILAAHSDERPLTLYEKGPHGEHRVYLSAKDQHWAHYAYEFAHELTHILSNHEHFAFSREISHNQWFAEALSEAASLYALKQLAFLWEVSPPHPNWRPYAPAFEEFAERLFNERHRRLPPDTSLATWFEQSEQDLRRDPYLRAQNEVVANVLLPLFEENPEIWQAIGYLPAKGASFQDYLRAWRANAPDDCKDIITYVMALFGFPRDGGVKETATSGTPLAEAAPTPGRRALLMAPPDA